ncbi:MAG: sugar ABC transporter permease [Bilifractor sp.]|jgi:D-xylose transport system permease protein
MANESSKEKKKLFGTANTRMLAMVIVLIVLWVVFAIITSGSFMTTRNFSNLLRQAAFTGIMAVGMTFVIITGGIDLSAGMTMGFIGCVMAALQVWNGVSTPVTILVGLLLGIGIGWAIGAIIAYSGMAPFIVTLGSQLVFRGLMLWITGGQTIAPFQESYKFWGTAYVPKAAGWVICVVACLGLLWSYVRDRRSKIKYGLDAGSMGAMIGKWILFSAIIVAAIAALNDFQGIPVPVLVMFIVVLVFSFVANNTTFGRSVYAIGGNMAAAKYAGINVKKSLVIVYTINTFLCAVAAVIYTARLNGGTSQVSNGNYELDAIASSVIGGTSMTGGVGKVGGAILGAVIMMSIDNGMSMKNLDAYWQFIVKGIILVLAVLFDTKTQQTNK